MPQRCHFLYDAWASEHAIPLPRTLVPVPNLNAMRLRLLVIGLSVPWQSIFWFQARTTYCVLSPSFSCFPVHFLFFFVHLLYYSELNPEHPAQQLSPEILLLLSLGFHEWMTYRTHLINSLCKYHTPAVCPATDFLSLLLLSQWQFCPMFCKKKSICALKKTLPVVYMSGIFQNNLHVFLLELLLKNKQNFEQSSLSYIQ